MPSNNDDAFLAVLAGCTDACANMDLSDDNWMPPDGPYDVQFDSIETGTKEKDGVVNAWVKPTFSVIDGEFSGRTFTDFYWIPAGMTEPTMSVKNLCRFATCMAGRNVTDPIEAITVLNEAQSEFVSVEIYRNLHKPTQKVYTNIRFMRSLASTEAE